METGPATPTPAAPTPRERVVVALSGAPEGETLIRRAAAVAGRRPDTELVAVHVERGVGDRDLRADAPGALQAQRALCERLGGTLHRVTGSRVAPAVIDFATGAHATLLVVGLPRRSRWARSARGLLGDETGAEIVRRAAERGPDQRGPLDVLVVGLDPGPDETGPLLRGREGRSSRLVPRSVLSPGRRIAGWALALLLPVLQVLLTRAAGHPGLPVDLLLLVVVTVLAALVGGLAPALAAALFGSLLINYFLTPPLRSFSIASPENAFGLVVGVLVALAVGTVVRLSARRLLQARRASAEAEVLSELAGSVARGEDTLPAVTERLRSTFGLARVTLEERRSEPDGWAVLESATADTLPSGAEPATPQTAPATALQTAAATATVTITDRLRLVLTGPTLSAADRRVLQAFAARVGAIVERDRLREQSRRTELVEAGDAMRRSLLAAVSHDLRTPLASITAGISSLRQTDVDFAPEDRAALLELVADSGRRLERLIDNLLDLSRLEAGIATPTLRTVSVDEIVWPALPPGTDDLPGTAPAPNGDPAPTVGVDLPEGLPLVRTDAGLLERALANLVDNARKHASGPVEVRVRLDPGADPGAAELSFAVIDHGPGVPAELREAMFAPFRQVGDRRRDGVGLGLAVASGFAQALGGRIEVSDTDGGGLTMTLVVPVGLGHAAPVAGD